MKLCWKCVKFNGRICIFVSIFTWHNTTITSSFKFIHNYIKKFIRDIIIQSPKSSSFIRFRANMALLFVRFVTLSIQLNIEEIKNILCLEASPKRNSELLRTTGGQAKPSRWAEVLNALEILIFFM